MNASEPTSPIEHSPLPLAQFRRFVTIFHVVFIGGLLFCLLLRWRQPERIWTWRDAVLLGLVTVQIALYCRFLVVPWTLHPPYRIWGIYFTASLAIWLAEWRLENSLQWIAWAYLGQMFGILPPRFSLPAAIAVVLTFFGIQLDWADIAHFSVWQWVAGAWGAISFISLGLFLHHLVTTSSERAKLIDQLRAAQKQLESARQRDTELAALRERERLARDLHDSLGHGLVTLTVQLEAVQRLYAVDAGKASALLDEMKNLTRTCMEELRRSLAGLRAPGLGDRPLDRALRELASERSRNGSLSVECELGEGLESLAPSVAEVLWRVAQEGLMNVDKHARADSASVSLRLDSDKAVVSVRDNGIGMPPDAESRQGHYGLRGLRERVEGLGGEFRITSTGPRGSLLEAHIPVLTR